MSRPPASPSSADLSAAMPLAFAGQRIGLMGGTFNPPHAGHATCASTAIRRLHLDQLWWMVTPGNPLKSGDGLPPLAVDPWLLKSARRHAAWMTNARSMTHTSQSVRENIAMGQNSSSEVLNAWMNSSGHRANILNPGYTRIGVAAYTTPEGTIYWCQQFLR